MQIYFPAGVEWNSPTASLTLGLLRQHLVRPHHFVVLVIEVMAMPNVAVWIAFELCDDSRDHRGVGAHGILPSDLVRLRRDRWPRVPERLARCVGKLVELSAVKDLKAYRMKMNRMGVVGEVNQVPDFGRAQH